MVLAIAIVSWFYCLNGKKIAKEKTVSYSSKDSINDLIRGLTLAGWEGGGEMKEDQGNRKANLKKKFNHTLP